MVPKRRQASTWTNTDLVHWRVYAALREMSWHSILKILTSNIFLLGVIAQPCGNFKWAPGLWWRHQIEGLFALLAICVGNSPVTGEIPTQRPVTWSFDVFFDLRVTKWLNKLSWGWWFETPSSSLWRHCKVKRNNVSATVEKPIEINDDYVYRSKNWSVTSVISTTCFIIDNYDFYTKTEAGL